MKSSILLLYITEFSGHHKATLAIEEAIKRLDPQRNIFNLNGFGYVSPFMDRFVHALYIHIIHRLPGIWEFLYDNPAIFKKIQGIKERVNELKQEKVKHLIEENQCRVVVCSQAFPCGIVAAYKKLHHSNISLIAVVTDFLPHTYWIYDEVDYYIVASQEAKTKLVDKGVAEHKILIFGIPIDPKFSAPSDKVKIAQELGITLDKPIILMMGGGRGIGPLKELIDAIDISPLDVRCVIVAGSNENLYQWLKKRHFEKPVVIFSFVDFVDRLMSLADVIITKPGGITTAEAISKQLPMMIMRPIPGQEQNNTDFLLRQGIAQKADSVEDAVTKLAALLNDRARLVSIKEKMSLVAKPSSSLDIAKLALSLC